MCRPVRPRKARLFPNPLRSLSRAALGAAVAFAWQAVPALATPAPVWSQFQGGPGHPGTLADGPAPPYRQAWSFHPPKGALSGAVIAGDVAIAVGEDAVYGLDLATGERKWLLVRYGGPLSMPAVGLAGDRQVLVYADEAGSGASLVGVDLSSTQEIWRVPLGATSRSGVTIDGDTALVADEDGNVYAVKLDAGTLAWTSKTEGAVDAAVAVSDGKVFVVVRDTAGQRMKLLALDEASGKQVWEYSPRAAGSTASAPAAADGVAVIGSADRFIRSIDPDGRERWGSLSNSLFSPVSSPALAGGYVYIADASGGLYRVDASTGERVWDYQLNDLIVRSSPVVAGSAALIGLNDGRLVAVDVDSGDLVWQSPAKPGSIGAIALSPQVVVAVRGGSEGGLVAFVHDDAGKLVDIPTPTKVDAGRLFGNYVLALVIVTAALFVPFRLLASRFGGTAVPASGGDEDADESTEDEDGDEA